MKGITAETFKRYNKQVRLPKQYVDAMDDMIRRLNIKTYEVLYMVAVDALIRLEWKLPTTIDHPDGGDMKSIRIQYENYTGQFTPHTLNCSHLEATEMMRRLGYLCTFDSPELFDMMNNSIIKRVDQIEQ